MPESLSPFGHVDRHGFKNVTRQEWFQRRQLGWSATMVLRARVAHLQEHTNVASPTGPIRPTLKLQLRSSPTHVSTSHTFVDSTKHLLPQLERNHQLKSNRSAVKLLEPPVKDTITHHKTGPLLPQCFGRGTPCRNIIPARLLCILLQHIHNCANFVVTTLLCRHDFQRDFVRLVCSNSVSRFSTNGPYHHLVVSI